MSLENKQGNESLVIVFWNLGLGGIQTRLVKIIEYLLQNTNLNIYLLLKGRTVNDLVLPKSKRLTIKFFHENSPVGYKFSFLVWLIEQLSTIKPTYLLTFSVRFSVVGVIYKFVCFFKKRSCKFVISEEIFASYYLKQYEAWYWRYLVMLFYRFADQIIVLTQVMKEDLVKNFFISDSRIKVVKSWITPSKLQKRKKVYDLIFMGRFSPEKGLDLLLTLALLAKKRSKKICICLVGDGELREIFDIAIGKLDLGDYFDLVGYKNNPFPYLQQSELLVLPSKNEGTPMVILEAASLGIASVVTPFTGAEEVIKQGQTGFIFSRKRFLFQTLRLLQEKSLLKWLGRNSKVYVRQKFSLTNLKTFIEVSLG